MSSLFNIMYHGDLADIEDHLEAGVELDAATLGALLTNIVRKVRALENPPPKPRKHDPDEMNDDSATERMADEIQRAERRINDGEDPGTVFADLMQFNYAEEGGKL